MSEQDYAAKKIKKKYVLCQRLLTVNKCVLYYIPSG